MHPLRSLIAGAVAVSAGITLTPSTASDAKAAPQPSISTVDSKPANSPTNAWGTFPGGERIEVWTEARVDGAWSKSQERTTRQDGSYAIPLTYGHGSAGEYTFRVGGKYPDGRVVYTDPATLTRLGNPTAAHTGERHVGVASRVWGSVDEAETQPVWTEVKLPDGRWSRSQRATLNADGEYHLRLTYGKNTPGKYQYRVGTRHDDGTVAYSSPFSFTRFGGSATANAASTAMVGATANAWGRFADGEGIEVWTEAKLPDGRWSRSRSGKTNKSGGYTLPLTYGASSEGTRSFRVAGRYPDGHVARTNVVQLRRVGGTSAGSSMKYTWMRQAGIPSSDWVYADKIVTRESGWNPRAVNRSSGACGLPQAYPCRKLGPNWADPVHALKWQYSYVKSRYGGYKAAYVFWQRHRWY